MHSLCFGYSFYTEIEALLRHVLTSKEIDNVEETLAAIKVALGKNSAWIDYYLVTGQLKLASGISDVDEDIINALPKVLTFLFEYTIQFSNVTHSTH
jgi:hypothetical protein